MAAIAACGAAAIVFVVVWMLLQRLAPPPESEVAITSWEDDPAVIVPRVGYPDSARPVAHERAQLR